MQQGHARLRGAGDCQLAGARFARVRRLEGDGDCGGLLGRNPLGWLDREGGVVHPVCAVRAWGLMWGVFLLPA
eukprot:403981-Pelagomonas_calceolata.AAC.3